MLFSLLYEIGLVFFALFALPKLCYQMLVHKKYRQSFGARLGFSNLPPLKKKSFIIWIHAVSIGETKAIVPLAKLLKNSYSQASILISSGTETGHAEAKRCIPFADHHLYFPFDFRWTVQRVLKQTRPDLIILSETDYWYNFARYAKKMGAKLVVVNGKLSAKSLKRFQKFKGISRRLFSLFDLFCVQNSLYRSRFEALGIENLRVTGNLKFDEPFSFLSDADRQQGKKRLGIAAEDPVLVIGSTHAPEEEWLLLALEPVWKAFPRLKVLLAPRHPERFSEVAHLLSKKNIPYISFREINQTKGKSRLILLDVMGELRHSYQFADLAIVGGSYVKHVGGHNILEPCGYAVPVLFGPYTHAQPDFVDLALSSGAGIQVPLDKVSETVIELLRDTEKRKKIGQSGLQLIEENRGATQRSLEAIQSIFDVKS